MTKRKKIWAVIGGAAVGVGSTIAGIVVKMSGSGVTAMKAVILSTAVATAVAPFAFNDKGVANLLRGQDTKIKAYAGDLYTLFANDKFEEAKAGFEKLGEELTGFVVHDSGMAVGVLKAVEEAGLRCSEDISIVTVGFIGDERPEDYLLRINFTAFCWSVEEMGRQAGSFLLDRIENKVDTRRTIQISGRLLEGNSTIAIPSRDSSLSANGQKRVKDSERRKVGV